MIHHKIRLFALLMTLVLVSSCCKNDYPEGGEAPPLWSTNLVLGSFPFVDKNGVIGYPKYGNDIIFHTTLYEDDNYNQDNRLVGLDAETGQIKWIFPKDTTQLMNYRFNGRGYLSGDHLVVKNCASVGHPWSKNQLLGINLRTLEFDWIIDLTFIEGGNTYDVFGYDGYAYHAEDNSVESRIFRTNVVTGDTATIRRIEVTEQNTMVYMGLESVSVVDGVPLLIFTEYHGVPDVWRPENPAAKKIVRSFNLLTGEFRDLFEVFDKAGGYTMRGIVSGNSLLWDVGRTMYCIDIPTGKLVWTYNFKQQYIHELMACSGVVLGIGGNDYCGVDLATGQELYLNKQVGNLGMSATDGRLIYMNILGKIWVVDPRSGNRLAILVSVDKNNDGSYISMPAIHGDKLYLMSVYKAYCYSLYPW